MKLSKVHVIITSGLTQTSAVFWFGKKYISEFCLRVYTSTVNSRRLAYAPFEFYFQHLRNHLASGARSLQHVKHVKPSFTVSFDVLTFHTLTRKTVFQKVDGV